ncbi:MFS general substrate transporter, partial [Mycena leptocephala]
GNHSLEKASDEQLADAKIKASSEEELDFGGDSSLPPPPTLSEEEERKLWRKVDLRLMPILSLMYLLSFLDRGNARLDGLQDQLNLTGNKYNIALTMYFVPYCMFECPANLVLKRFRPSKWLPGSRTLMGLVKTYPQLVGVRVSLGIAEAGLFPLSLWYPRHMLQLRIGLFFGAASLAGAFSGLLAYGINFMSGTHKLLGWSGFLFCLVQEGIATVAVGLLAFFVLVDFPALLIVWRKKYDNSSVGEEEHFEMRHLVQALLDWQVWLHILIYMSIIGPLYGITLFLPHLLFIFAYWSDKIQKRAPFIYAGLLMLLVGFSINISTAPPGVKYFGTYAAFPGVHHFKYAYFTRLGNNLSGQYKRGVGMALHIGIGNFSDCKQHLPYSDKPRFLVGPYVVGIGLICVPIAVVTYTRINNRRDEVARGMLERGETHLYSRKELREMGDRAPDFRYTI